MAADPAAIETFQAAPPGRLQGQVEAFARELHDLKARLTALAPDADAGTATIRIPSVQLHEPAARPSSQKPPGDLPPADAPWWPAPFDETTAMLPSPGHRCAGIRQEDAIATAISCCGLSADMTAAVIEQTIAEQIQTRDFTPLFLTDDAELLHMFRHQGLDVELVPTEAELAASGAMPSINACLARRMQRIKQAWAIVDYSDKGARPLPWPASPAAPVVQWRHAPSIYFFKDYRRYNPYQRLFHYAMPGLSYSPGDLDAALAEVETHPTGFHLNWEEAIFREAEDAAEALAMVEAYLAKLSAFQRAGGRIIWTLHNEVPHENRFPDIYHRLATGVAKLSDLVVCHSRQAGDVARDRYGVDPDVVCVAPHGGYHAFYERADTKAKARRAIGLEETGVLFGFVGAVRSYKNVPLLIEAFTKLEAEARLLIAGPHFGDVHLEPSAEIASIIIRDAVIPDEELALYVSACDVMVLPFDKVLTSGSVLLSLSLGVPVMAPRLKGMADTLQDNLNAMLFDKGDPDALAERMAEFLAMSDASRGNLARNALQTAHLLDWGWIGRMVERRIAALFDTERQPQRQQPNGADR